MLLIQPLRLAAPRFEVRRVEPAVLVPASAVINVTGAARAYLIKADDTVEERLVTTGQVLGNLVEITSGLKAGDTVATSNVAQLTDGARVAERK